MYMCVCVRDCGAPTLFLSQFRSDFIFIKPERLSVFKGSTPTPIWERAILQNQPDPRLSDYSKARTRLSLCQPTAAADF